MRALIRAQLILILLNPAEYFYFCSGLSLRSTETHVDPSSAFVAPCTSSVFAINLRGGGAQKRREVQEDSEHASSSADEDEDLVLEDRADEHSNVKGTIWCKCPLPQLPLAQNQVCARSQGPRNILTNNILTNASHLAQVCRVDVPPQGVNRSRCQQEWWDYEVGVVAERIKMRMSSRRMNLQIRNPGMRSAHILSFCRHANVCKFRHSNFLHGYPRRIFV